MKQRLLGAMITMLALVGPATAQSREPGALPPGEIIGIVRDGGFDPLGQPVRRGPNYVLRAVDDNDREVSVVINARSGDIVSVKPVATASRVPPGGSMGPYERMAPGYVPPGPSGAYRGGPPMIYEDDEPVYQRPPASIPNAPPSGYTARPQAPGSTPGANTDADEDGAPPPDRRPLRSTEIPPPAGPQDGLLPPPPERFPQRAAPAAPPKPKPVKRASAAPLKTAPLPKPRPGTAAAPPPPPAAPQAAPPAPPPDPAPAPDETPN